MDKSSMLDAITAQRNRLIDTLEARPVADFDVQSLCEGWRVRDTVGHLVSILEIPLGTFLLNIVKSRGFDRYAARVAGEIGARDPHELLRTYRSLAGKRFSPPGVGPIAPLTDVYVHTRDVERPLGIGSTLDPAVLPTILAYVLGGKARGFVPAKRTNGLRFEATDLDWRIGDGPLVSGTAEALMMAATARPIALDDLSGDGVVLLRQRLA